MNLYRSVLEDIDWLHTEWWLGEPDELTDGHLRRGSAALHLLLVEGAIQKAWLHYGFARQPVIQGPDIAGLAAREGLKLELAASLIAGGGRVSGLILALVGGFRVDNPSTGVPAEAESGFAVCVGSIVRDATKPSGPSPLDSLVERPWFLSDYLEAPGAVRRSHLIKRREVIQYFRNYRGGAHHDLLGGAKHGKQNRYQLIAELERKVHADVRDGLHFELLSIGQAVARSSDIVSLAEKIRADS